eukprot:955864-Alexandrium_andersonii.AAC.1
MSASLVGSEMCIRDRFCPGCSQHQAPKVQSAIRASPVSAAIRLTTQSVSYTHLTLPTICSV